MVDNTARPLRLEDPKGLMSRAHVQIQLDGWQVQVVDLGSANGTGVFGPGDTAWQPAPRMTPVRDPARHAGGLRAAAVALRVAHQHLIRGPA